MFGGIIGGIMSSVGAGISAVATAVGGFISGVASTVGPAVTGFAKNVVSVIVNHPILGLNLFDVVGIISNIIHAISDFLGIKSEENPEILGAKAEQCEKKLEDFDNDVEAYIKYLREEIELDKEKFDKMTPEERLGCRAVGMALETKAIENKIGGIEIPPESLLTLARIQSAGIKMDAKDVVNTVEALKSEGVTNMNDVAEFLEGKGNSDRIKTGEALSKALGEKASIGFRKVLRKWITDRIISDKSGDIEWLDLDTNRLIWQIRETKCVQDDGFDTAAALLHCEKIRAGLDIYDNQILTDPNRGHWDLWAENCGMEYAIGLPAEYVARNPLNDINTDGVIAIDFGTKSTIVVYQSDVDHSLPMGIGNCSGASLQRYENPTVMHFVNLDEFISDYTDKKGRPYTKWEDLTISHTAMEEFRTSQSQEYYEFLYKIKQWAGQRKKQYRIQPHTGKSRYLPPFLELKDDDWNPIEYYAYFIGLNINNMRKGHGIFMEYYLSFPVTFESKVRAKIVSSFEKGLKKSFPTSVLNDEAAMKHFKVRADTSEPTAYVVCALQQYGFDPKGDEKVFYGIFDFGGGTADFDFGLWMQSSKARYDYAIETVGTGGDRYLGGENILEILAFEVFKANRDMMLEKGYSFALAPKQTEFLGSDLLLADSQEAEKNMYNLMEELRPFWEKKASSSNDFIESPNNGNNDRIEGSIVNEDKGLTLKVTLFDRDGVEHRDETLVFSEDRINQIIENQIKDGVSNYFSLLTHFYYLGKVEIGTKVNILLAGNSCKSPVVKKVFEEAASEWEEKIKAASDSGDSFGALTEIFPPLGTEEAFKKMETMGIKMNPEIAERPTGKSGVAFGLIDCRSGGRIEIIEKNGIEDEIPFQYYIGYSSKKKFVPYQDEQKSLAEPGKIRLNEWYRFMSADEGTFDLYFTTMPESADGDYAVSGNAAVKRLRSEIDTIDPSAYIYVRAVSPHTLEYVVSKSDDVENEKIGEVFQRELH